MGSFTGPVQPSREAKAFPTASFRDGRSALDSLPDQRWVYAVILMAQTIPDKAVRCSMECPDKAFRHRRRPYAPLRSKPGAFAPRRHSSSRLPGTRSNPYLRRTARLTLPPRKCHARDEGGSLKGKNSLFVGCRANTLFHCLGGREVHLDLKKFGQAVLKTNHVQQCQFLFVVKFRDQIDVGRIVRISSSHRTEHAQMDECRRRSVRPGIRAASR